MDIKSLCLGILALGDATGYEIKKMVAEGSFSFFSEASYGSIYPALTKMTEDGLVTCREETQDGRPDKKIYSITHQGRNELMKTLSKDHAPDKVKSEFLAFLLFSEAMAPEKISDMITTRISQHRDKIRSMEELLNEEMTPASRFVVEYSLASQKAALSYLLANKDALSD